MKFPPRPFIPTAVIVYTTNDTRLITRIWQLYQQQRAVESKLRAYKLGFWILLIVCVAVALIFILR